MTYELFSWFYARYLFAEVLYTVQCTQYCIALGTESNNMEYSLLQQKVLTEITVMFTFLDR